MTNEIRRGITRERCRSDPRTGNQKEILATHARQLKYLDTCSRSESDRADNYSDIATLPGVKIPFVVPEPLPRKTMRNSIRKLPRRSSSAKDKKKEAEKDKRKSSDSEKKPNGSKASSSPEEETAGQTESGHQHEEACQGGVIVTCEEGIVAQVNRPIMGSLDPSELMLVSADKGDFGTMQVMLKKSSEDPNSLCVTKDSNGETPLHKTAKGGYLKCLKCLAAQVPDQVSCLDNSGMTPAAHAAKNGHVNCLKWLVEETSAYVELAVRDGQTSLLHHAASEGMEQCLTYLLAFMAKRKITTDIIDGQGQSPLHTAAKMGHMACVQTLVEHGADVLAKDHEGLTAASLAYIQKHSMCSRYLLMAESCWILASRVATLFREVNGFKKENKELKKSVENLKARKKSFPKDLPNRPETVGAHVDESGNQIDEISQTDLKASIGLRERNFPDGESPKSTFTEADKRRPQIVSPRLLNRDGEVNDIQHFKVVRQGSNTSDSIPVVSTNGIAEIPPAEKIKAKEIAMVTHQLMSTRHLQLVKNKKTLDMSPPEVEPTKIVQATVDDAAVVMRRTNGPKSKAVRPKSLCDTELKFMRSSSDLGFGHKTKQPVLERRASCTEINNQSKLEANDNNAQRLAAKDSDSDLSPTDSNKEKETFWEKVGARKLLSRKKNAKSRLSGGLSDLQTASTDKILELYARESRGSTSRVNSFIKEEDETSPLIGRRTMSSLELKSYTRDASIHASFREPRANNFKPMSDLRMSERLTSKTQSGGEVAEVKKVSLSEVDVSDVKKVTLSEIETPDAKPSGVGELPKRVRPVAKPRQKLKSATSESDVSKQTVGSFTTKEIRRTVVRKAVTEESLDSSEGPRHFRSASLDSYGYTWNNVRTYEDTQRNQDLECTDV